MQRPEDATTSAPAPQPDPTRMDIDEGAGAHDHSPYTWRQRADLALAYALHKYAGAALADAVRSVWSKESGAVPPGAERRCKMWFERLRATGSVFDLPGRGRKHKLPDEVAAEAAKLVKAGLEVQPMHGRVALPKRRIWFHTLDEAVRHTPRLGQILTDYGIQVDHLLRRMHEVDKGLHWGRLDIKGALSADHKAARQTYAADLLRRLAAEPTLFDRFVWVDEVKIWLFGGNSADVHVWCDAHDEGVHLVLPGCGKVGSKPIRVCMYVAVNPKLGLVGYQYTPPTTGFPDTWPQAVYAHTPGAADRQDPPYTAEGEKRKAAHAEDFAAIIKVLSLEAKRRFIIAGVRGAPIVSFDNASIHTSRTSEPLLPPGIEHHPLPARSPDMHKVIEHVFGRTKPAVAGSVVDATWRRDINELSAAQCRPLIERCLREATTPAAIAADSESLKTTLQIIAHDKDVLFTLDGREFKGTGGDWAPRRWR